MRSQRSRLRERDRREVRTVFMIVLHLTKKLNVWILKQKQEIKQEWNWFPIMMKGVNWTSKVQQTRWWKLKIWWRVPALKKKSKSILGWWMVVVRCTYCFDILYLMHIMLFLRVFWNLCIKWLYLMLQRLSLRQWCKCLYM